MTTFNRRVTVARIATMEHMIQAYDNVDDLARRLTS